MTKQCMARYNRQVEMSCLDWRFVAIVRNADETKMSLKKSIADVEQIIKGLING